MTICVPCANHTDNLGKEDIPYLQGLLIEQKGTSAGTQYVKYRLDSRETVATEPMQEEKRIGTNQIPEKESAPGSTGLIIAGMIFLIAAIILYFVSIKNVGSVQIANIQGSVFCAACFIVSMVCFACNTVIKHLSNR